MTVKESFSMKGVLTTCGWDKLKDHRAKDNAAVVEKLLKAGVIIIGKTNLPVLASDFQSYNPIYGCSNNPWNVEHSPGGSSGGSAGALAAGFTPLEVGSDIGGSIRGPAHCCGIVGHKPSLGIIDSTGHVPPAPFSRVPSNLYVVGPMARCCSDIALMLDILSGPPTHMKDGWALNLRPPRVPTTQGLRVAVCCDHDFCPVEPAIATSIEVAAKSLAAAGAKVDFSARPGFGFSDAMGVYVKLLEAENAGAGAKIKHGEYLRNEDKRIKIKHKWAEFFANFDVFLCPVASRAALKHDHSEPVMARTMNVNGVEVPYYSWIQWAGLIILADLPATVVPVGKTPEGLPIGVQVVAAAYQDRTSIHVGSLLEQYHRRFEAPALVMARL